MDDFFHGSKRRFVKQISRKLWLLKRNNSGQRVAQAYRAKVTITQGSFWNTTNTGVSEASWLVCFSDVRPQHHQHYTFKINWRRNTAQFFLVTPPPLTKLERATSRQRQGQRQRQRPRINPKDQDLSPTGQ